MMSWGSQKWRQGIHTWQVTSPSYTHDIHSHHSHRRAILREEVFLENWSIIQKTHTDDERSSSAKVGFQTGTLSLWSGGALHWTVVSSCVSLSPEIIRSWFEKSVFSKSEFSRILENLDDPMMDFLHGKVKCLRKTRVVLENDFHSLRFSPPCDSLGG